jgi:two-component system cell cycle sensor histidine kinase/response regulator CckA
MSGGRGFVAGAPAWRQEFRAIDRHGRLHWFAQVASLRPAGRGRWHVTTINTDITERKETEETLRWRTALFEAQVDAALDGILVVNHAGKKILQNERMTQLWKIPREVVEDPDDSQQLRYVTGRTKNPGQFAEKVAHLYSHPEAISRDEVELVDGTVLDRYSAPVRDRAGKYYGRIWTFRDITATRQLEAQYRQAQKMEAVGQLAGGIAHDFNNLLTVIHLQTSMILLEKSLGEAVEQSVQQIKEAATRAANLTRQLLTFSRQDLKQARALDIGEVVSSTTKLLRRVLGEDVSLESRFASGLPLVQADPGMMEQVLMNLVINARDAMPGGGKLAIALDAVELDATHVAAHPSARTGRFVCLSVSDTGNGISPEILPRIFEPFFTTKDVGKGTGLGLATVYGILQQHLGWIETTSELGRGSTFRVFLPAIEEAAAGDVAVLAPAVRGGTEKILLVEDEAVVREVATAALQRRGYQVINAATAAEALHRWDEHRGEFDLLLTDLIMPGGISGQKLAEELGLRCPGLKVIFSSGYSDDVATRQLRLTPGQNFLPKPYPLEDLLRIVRQRLDGT